jgi:hypothetical protein
MLLHLLVLGAHAACGLELCPPTAAPTSSIQVPFTIEVARSPGGDASWVRALPGVRWRDRGWSLGATLPMAALSYEGARGGLGNPLLAAELGVVQGPLRPRVGAQLELPLGSPGIADLHWTALPYVGLAAGAGPVSLQLQVGLRSAIEPSPRAVTLPTPTTATARVPDADHVEPSGPTDEPDDGPVLVAADRSAPPPSPIDPHARSEFVWRAAVGWGGLDGPIRARAVLMAQQPLRSAPSFDVGPRVTVQLSQRILATAGLRVPVGGVPRFQWQTSAGLNLML